MFAIQGYNEYTTYTYYPNSEILYDSAFQKEIRLNTQDISKIKCKYLVLFFKVPNDTELDILQTLIDNIEYFIFSKQNNIKNIEYLDNVHKDIYNYQKNVHTFSIITDGFFQLVNIDTINKTIDFGDDPIFLIDGKCYVLKDLDSKQTFRNVLYYDQNSESGATYIVFNIDTYEIYAKIYKNTPNINEIIIGTVRSTYESHNYIYASLPCDYTVNGKYLWENEYSTNLRSRTGLTFIAHRGVNMNNIPENSLDAYRYAGYCGFEYAETDFCPTADDQLVLMHDATINRTMANKSDYSDLTENISVRSKTLQELRDNYILKSANPKYRKTIPTLEVFFITCRNSGVFPIPEIKTSGTTNEHVKQAYELGKKIMGDGNFGFCSFSPTLLDYARSLSEKTLLLYINDGILGTTNTVTGKSRESEYTWWYPSYSGYGLSKDKVRQYKEAGIKVAVWTVPINEFDNMMKTEVDCIATDYISPDLDKMYGIVVKSNDNFIQFSHNGTLIDNMLSLSPTQKITYEFNNYKLGGYYISIIGKGKFNITFNNNLNKTITSEESDRFIYQGLFLYNYGTQFKITAVEDTIIESIEMSVVEY